MPYTTERPLSSTSLTPQERTALLTNPKIQAELQQRQALSEPEHGFLEGTGFKVWNELGSALISYMKYTSQGLSPEDAFKKINSDIEGNVIGFKYEYLMQLSLLPNPVELVKMEGRDRLFGKFGNRLLVETVDERERFGSVKAVIGNLDQQVDSFAPGTVFGFTSGPGRSDLWMGSSGLKDGAGKEIVYVDTQTYMFKKTAHGLEALTLITDADIRSHSAENMQFDETYAENKRFLRNLGITNPLLGQGNSAIERAADIIRTPFILRPNETGERDFKEVIMAMQQATGKDVVREVRIPGMQPKALHYDELYKTLERKDQLLQVDGLTTELLHQFGQQLTTLLPEISKQTGMNGVELQEMLMGKREEAMDLFASWLKQNPEGRVLADNLCQVILKIQESIYGKSLTGGNDKAAWRLMTTLLGCNGGEGFLTNALGPRAFLGDEDEEDLKYQWFEGDCTDKALNGFRGCGKKKVMVGPCYLCQDCVERWKREQKLKKLQKKLWGTPLEGVTRLTAN